MSRPLLVAYRALGLGDLLTGVPSLRGLRAALPDHRVVLAAPAALAPLAALSGAVDGVLDTAPLAVPVLRGADLAVNLHGRGPESHRAILASRPRRMIAFAAHDVPWRGPEWRAGEHEVERWCRLLAESGIAADPARLDLPAPAGTGAAAFAPGVTVVHPGAAGAARRWPAERWAAVACAERDAGRRVVVTGTAAERPLAEEVGRGAGLRPGDVLAGRTGLIQLAALVASAGRVLCGDTGVGHLATAFGVPSVLLFGPTPPSEWGPPPGRARHVVLHRGGRGDPHGLEPDPGLLEITVEDVLAVVGDNRFRVERWEKATG
ncbi:MAG TPA: glycosyltransferase family 9 protein [Solirubrobacteraceae bacterium]|nr:glycosyltransferase family 9 protein [Solirubrobacteraceae bacterium]